jgi:hypothetical protein
VISGVVFGFVTIIEVAALSIVYVLFLSIVVYRSLTLPKLISVFRRSAIASSATHGGLRRGRHLPVHRRHRAARGAAVGGDRRWGSAAPASSSSPRSSSCSWARCSTPFR